MVHGWWVGWEGAEDSGDCWTGKRTPPRPTACKLNIASVHAVRDSGNVGKAFKTRAHICIEQLRGMSEQQMCIAGRTLTKASMMPTSLTGCCTSKGVGP